MIRYLSRYVNKTAVSDKRIRKIENGNVYLSYIDRKKMKVGTEIIGEQLFLKRLVLHILTKRVGTSNKPKLGLFEVPWSLNISLAGKIIKHPITLWKTIENCSFQLPMYSENPILWIYGKQMSKEHTVALQIFFLGRPLSEQTEVTE